MTLTFNALNIVSDNMRAHSAVSESSGPQMGNEDTWPNLSPVCLYKVHVFVG